MNTLFFGIQIAVFKVFPFPPVFLNTMISKTNEVSMRLLDWIEHLVNNLEFHLEHKAGKKG